VDVVGDGEAVAGLGAALCGVEDALEVVFGDLDVGQLVVVVGVEVEVRDDVAEALHRGLAGVTAGGIWRAHICWVFAKDVAERHLVLNHLVVTLSLGDGAQVLVRPGVAGDLVALGDHAANNVCPARGRVDGALVVVDTGDEERGFETVLSELVEDLVGVDVRPIIVSDGYSSRVLAGIDTATTVRNVALLRARIVASACATGSLVGIACWTVFEQAIRSRAMVSACTTVSLHTSVNPVYSIEDKFTYCTGTTVTLGARSTSKAGTTTPILATLTSFEQTTLRFSDVTKLANSDRS
jgi:hypothetical protein